MTNKVTAVPGGSIHPAPGDRVHTVGSTRHRARLVVAASVAALALAGTAATADASVLDPAGAAAATPQHIGTLPAVPAGAVRTAAPASGSTIQLSIGLTPNDPAALQSYATAVSTQGSPEYHQFLAKGQFASVFGPSQATIAKVTAALKADGLEPGQVSADGLSIPVTTTLAGAAHAFGTGFTGYRLADGTAAYANTSTPQLPGDVAGYVSGIIGLNSLTQRSAQHTALPTVKSPATSGTASTTSSTAGSSTARPAATAVAPQLCSGAINALHNEGFGSDGHGYYSSNNLARTYNLPHTATSAAGVTIGVLEMEAYSTKDLAAYQSCYGTHVPVTVHKVDGGPHAAPNPAANTGVESLLDLEDLTSLAPGASIIDYEGPDLSKATDAQWLATYQAMVTDDRAQVLSISYGGCELYTGSAVMAAENYYSEEAAAQGQTIFVASGDTGAAGCNRAGGKDANAISVSDPASQPFVTSVGGTNLVGYPAYSRTTWNQGNAASGGGVSRHWALDTNTGWNYQKGFTGAGYSAAYCGAKSGYACRQVPDVSALAAPADGYAVYIGGKWTRIGGTSGASPTWAALAAIADAQPLCRANGPLGEINFTLYAAARASYAGYFTDITTGNNADVNDGGYNAGYHYDLATGLGEPNAGNLITYALCKVLPARTSGGTYHAITPTVLLNWREYPNDFGFLQVEGNARLKGMPKTRVTSVLVDITVSKTTGAGAATLWAFHARRPLTPTVRWTKANQTVTRQLVVPIGDEGLGFFTTNTGTIEVVVKGYYYK